MVDLAIWIVAFIIVMWFGWVVLTYAGAGIILVLSNKKARDMAGTAILIIGLLVGWLWFYN